MVITTTGGPGVKVHVVAWQRLGAWHVPWSKHPFWLVTLSAHSRSCKASHLKTKGQGVVYQCTRPMYASPDVCRDLESGHACLALVLANETSSDPSRATMEVAEGVDCAAAEAHARKYVP